ncbi:tyrosine-protein kinase STYK1-like isoform X2 [Syngnathoides biaculeatus]|uniref:tyrosine-protein kinase STYK1-like isoform X2 n=1 Tax=Syngnathoides biaculeatus TaxID=300417 RepID=UPI002ADE4F20|nr:tyrosine-protein kinase STYK1-like isoform X2 [Syngnathoides biaculeatus]
MTQYMSVAVTHRQAVIVIPSLLLLASAITVVTMIVLTYVRRRRVRRAADAAPPRYRRSLHRRSRHLQGVDAPPGIDPLEHEEVPMAVHKRATGAAVPRVTAEGRLGTFGQVTPLPRTLSVGTDGGVVLYRARVDHKGVVLRVLKDSAGPEERRRFLGFASFVSELGPHPFLPAALGSVRGPPPTSVMVVEDLRHGDLLGFLWRCRRADESGWSITEKRIFTMATQVASALGYLHSRSCVHGDVGARNVLVGGDLTAKLWGLGAAYRRRTRAGADGAAELKKWQAPEVLARRDFSPSSDVWSFGLLLYEMSTLGEPPFAPLRPSELLQHLQRGNFLQRPPGCSGTLFAAMSSCCQWNPRRRVTVGTLAEKLRAGERTANGLTPVRAAGPLDPERYLREAGYGEAYNYALL